MNRKIFIALFIGLCSLNSCKDMTKAKGLAATAILDFHRQFNDLKFKELYTAAHPDLKASASEADFLKLLEAVHRKLGKNVRSTEVGWRVNAINAKTMAEVTQNSEFEQGKGIETFTYVISGGTCTLQGYYISSQDMMTK